MLTEGITTYEEVPDALCDPACAHKPEDAECRKPLELKLRKLLILVYKSEEKHQLSVDLINVPMGGRPEGLGIDKRIDLLTQPHRISSVRR